MHIYLIGMTQHVPDPGPSQCHCFAARQSARYTSVIYDRHLAPIGLTINQFSMLAFLHHNPEITVSGLADLMVMERTSLVRALKPLQRDGLIEQAPDGRRLLLSLLPLGRAKLKIAAPLWRAAQTEFETLIGSERAQRLRDDLLQTTHLAAERAAP
jgi:DNA-binding MarR family transcriptional regulator